MLCVSFICLYRVVEYQLYALITFLYFVFKHIKAYDLRIKFCKQIIEASFKIYYCYYTLECKIKFTSMYFKIDMNGGECRRKVDLLTKSIPQKEPLIILRMTNGD